MTEKIQDELRVLLQEGAAAVKEIRSGMEHARIELRNFTVGYGPEIPRNRDSKYSGSNPEKKSNKPNGLDPFTSIE